MTNSERATDFTNWLYVNFNMPVPVKSTIESELHKEFELVGRGVLDRIEQLKARVAELEEGLKWVVAAAVLEPVAASLPTHYVSPYTIRTYAQWYLDGKPKAKEAKGE